MRDHFVHIRTKTNTHQKLPWNSLLVTCDISCCFTTTSSIEISHLIETSVYERVQLHFCFFIIFFVLSIFPSYLVRNVILFLRIKMNCWVCSHSMSSWSSHENTSLLTHIHTHTIFLKFQAIPLSYFATTFIILWQNS